MSQKSLISKIVPFASGWSRTGTNSIQGLIAEALDELFNYDAPYMKFIDPSDNKGFPPYLTTVDGTYKYSINAANLSVSAIQKNIDGTNYDVRCRQVNKVFVDSSNLGYNLKYVGEPFLYSSLNPYSSSTSRQFFSEIPVDSYPSMGDSTDAYIVFKENPGDTTKKFFVDFLWTYPALTSENIPLPIPQSYEKAIEDYVIGKIQRRSNGKMGEDENRFYTYWIPRFRQEVASGGAQAVNKKVIPIYC